MSRDVVTFEIPELPDPTYARFQTRANGEVTSAVWRDCEHLLRTLANFPAGSVTAGIRFCFSPNDDSSEIQSRLQLALMISGKDGAVAERVSSLVRCGPLSRFYDFISTTSHGFSSDGFRAACDIVRRAQLVKPLYTQEFNVNIPGYYFTIESFEASETNDYSLLDQVLGNIGEPVAIAIYVEPVDIAAETAKHTEYLARLRSVNRGREASDDLPTEPDYLGTEEVWRPRLGGSLRPLRYRDPLADDILRTEQRFHATLLRPHLLFHIRVLSVTPAVANLVGSTLAESAFAGGTYRLVTYDNEDSLLKPAIASWSSGRVVSLPIHKALWDGVENGMYDGLLPLASVAPVEELCGAFRLPVATQSSPCCIRQNTDPEKEDASQLFVFGFDQDPPISKNGANDDGLLRGIRVDRLVKHLAVFGIPGTGKTTSQINTLIQLSERDIPFIVLETAKTEYRALKAFKEHRREDIRRLAQRLEVYTVGGTVSPFRFNPLEPSYVGRDEHVDNVLACFQAALPMPGPLLGLIAESLERVYEDFADAAHPPVIADLVTSAEQILAEKRYSGDTNSDLRAALEVRLGSLARRSIGGVFQCRHAVPTIAHLTSGLSIIELDRLPVEQSCLLSLFILTAICEHAKTTQKPDRPVRLVIVIEEAHNIVGRNTDARASEDLADPKSHAAALICRMLAELRARGVAIIIVDQLPSAVAPEVIKNTGSKLTFREIANDDRADLGGTMLFGETEFEEVARLQTGEAYFSTEGYHRPRRIRAVNLHRDLDLAAPPQDQRLLEYVCEEPWFRKAAETRTACELDQLREKLDAFDARRLRLTGRMSRLSKRRAEILALKDANQRSKRITELLRKARSLKQELVVLQKSFARGPGRSFRTLTDLSHVSAEIKTVFDGLDRRCREVFSAGLRNCLGLIERLIGDCARPRRLGSTNHAKKN